MTMLVVVCSRVLSSASRDRVTMGVVCMTVVCVGSLVEHACRRARSPAILIIVFIRRVILLLVTVLCVAVLRFLWAVWAACRWWLLEASSVGLCYPGAGVFMMPSGVWFICCLMFRVLFPIAILIVWILLMAMTSSWSIPNSLYAVSLLYPCRAP